MIKVRVPIRGYAEYEIPYATSTEGLLERILSGQQALTYHKWPAAHDFVIDGEAIPDYYPKTWEFTVA